MPKRQRNYRAEYERRQALARERGFRSYGQQRYRIETGYAPAIAPERITRDIHEQKFAGKRIQDWRIEAAEFWSTGFSRSEKTEFDPEQAREDPSYLDSYMDAFVMNFRNKDPDYHSFSDSPEVHDWLVGQGFMTEEEYQQRYGEKE